MSEVDELRMKWWRREEKKWAIKMLRDMGAALDLLINGRRDAR